MTLHSRYSAEVGVSITLAAFFLLRPGMVHAFETDTHGALSIVAVRDHRDSLVNDFLKNELQETNGLETTGQVLWNVDYTSRATWTYVRALKEGAIDEDSENGISEIEKKLDGAHRLRFIRHFYDPTRNGLGLNDSGGVPWTSFTLPQTNSLTWAWMNPGAVTDTKRGSDDFSWQAARRHYLIWLKHSDAVERQHQSGETFYALGHVIHLVQDLAQPQHTRNDAHAPVYLNGDSAPFEKFCSDNFNSPEAIKDLTPSSIPVFKHLPAEQSDGIPPEFRAFWDTGQIGSSGPDKGYTEDLGLAEFSNAFFVTSDTMFTGQPLVEAYHGHTILRPSRTPAQELADEPHRFFWPRLRDLQNLESVLPATPSVVTLAPLGEYDPILGWQTEDLARAKPYVPSYCSANRQLRLFLGITDKNRKAHARVLLPKAVAYSTGLLNYFFRGRLKMEFLSPDTSSSNPNPRIRITNLTTNEPLREGFFTLLREDPVSANRTVAAEITTANGYSGFLASGAAFTNTLPANIARDGKLILVFQGTIGNEKDIAVAAVVKPALCNSIELLANGGTTARVEFGDLITFERNIIGADGTRTPFPLTADSWLGTSYNFSDYSDHFLVASEDGKLRALRRGTWKLQPFDGGCVTVEVLSDGVTFWNTSGVYDYEDFIAARRVMECSVGGKSLVTLGPVDAKTPLWGNALNEAIFHGDSSHWYGYTFRLNIQPSNEMVLKNVGPIPRGYTSPLPATAAFQFFGGISPAGGSSPELSTRTPLTIPLVVPPDESPPPPPLP